MRIRDKLGGIVKVITMGPPQAQSALRNAIAFGADEGYLVSDPVFAGSDTWATSYTLAHAIKKLGSFETDEKGHFMTTMEIPENQKADRVDFKIKDKKRTDNAR